MGKIYWNLDAENVYEENGFHYEIAGWAIGEFGNSVQVEVIADETEALTFDIETVERYDVKEALPEAVSRIDVGFKVTLKNIKAIYKEHKNLVVWLTDGEERVKLLEKNGDDLKKVIDEKTLLYRIDEINQVDEILHIQGWAVDQYRENVISILEQSGRTIPHEMRRILRSDVNKACRLGKEAENDLTGFLIQIRRKDIRGGQVRLIFKNRVVEKAFVLDLKTFDYERSARAKLKKILAWEKRGENAAYIREHGITGFVDEVKRQLEPVYGDYNVWAKNNEPKKKKLRMQRRHRFSWNPLISVIIPLYNTPEIFLKIMLDSLLEQTYGNLEICLADGSSNDNVKEYICKKYGKEKRIRYQKLEKNGGISENTNAALAMASGEYIMLADHDDVVAPNALYEIVKVLNEDRSIDIIYTDEDKISMDGKNYFDPNFKSDFNLDLLRSVNYICHIFLVRKEIVDKIGSFRKEFDGAQDYDFILRCIEQTDHIYHIPKVLYHWRAHPNSTAGNPQSKQYAIDAGCNAIREHYHRMNVDAKVTSTDIFGIYRTVYRVKGHPLVSIVILNKDHIEDLKKCIDSVIKKTTYENYEIVVVENNSTKEATFRYYDEVESNYDCVRVVRWKEGFNYSKINNYGVKFTKGEYLILMNNDIEVIEPAWMEEMLGCAQRPEVGIVGAKLFYPDDTIQHAGVVLGMGGIAGHVLCKADGKEYGYNARLVTMQDISAVTAACLMISRKDFDAVGGLDEALVVAFNDIDLCMKIREREQLIIFNPYVTLYHYESKSRGLEDTPEKQKRFQSEVSYFCKKWKKQLEMGDPYYNVNLTLEDGDCSIKKATERH